MGKERVLVLSVILLTLFLGGIALAAWKGIWPFTNGKETAQVSEIGVVSPGDTVKLSCSGRAFNSPDTCHAPNNAIGFAFFEASFDQGNSWQWIIPDHGFPTGVIYPIDYRVAGSEPRPLTDTSYSYTLPINKPTPQFRCTYYVFTQGHFTDEGIRIADPDARAICETVQNNVRRYAATFRRNGTLSISMPSPSPSPQLTPSPSPNPSPSSSPIAQFQCLDFNTNASVPLPGTSTIFVCRGQATHTLLDKADFRVLYSHPNSENFQELPEYAVSEVKITNNQANYTLNLPANAQNGSYKVQCRLCTNNGQCTNWGLSK